MRGLGDSQSETAHSVAGRGGDSPLEEQNLLGYSSSTPQSEPQMWEELPLRLGEKLALVSPPFFCERKPALKQLSLNF